MPHRHAAGMVSSTFSMASLRERQFANGPAFVDMIVYRSSEMSKTRGDGPVGAEFETAFLRCWRGREVELGRGGWGFANGPCF